METTIMLVQRFRKVESLVDHAGHRVIMQGQCRLGLREQTKSKQAAIYSQPFSAMQDDREPFSAWLLIKFGP
jgi:hypothetical protein